MFIVYKQSKKTVESAVHNANITPKGVNFVPESEARIEFDTSPNDFEKTNIDANMLVSGWVYDRSE